MSMRHTHAFAGIQDRTAIHRTHDGVFLQSVECGIHLCCISRGCLSEAAEEAADHGHEHDTRHIADRRQAVAAARARKSEALGKLRSKFQEIMNVLEVEGNELEFERLIQDGDERLLAWRQYLPPVAARVISTRARRPRAEEQQKGPRRGKRHQQSKKREEAAPKSFRKGHGTSRSPITIASSSSGQDDAECSSSSDPAAAGFHYSDNYSHSDATSD